METRYTDSIRITWTTDEMVVLMMVGGGDCDLSRRMKLSLYCV